MNPLTNVKNITKLNEIELSKGTAKSWHDMYKDSAWIFIGGLAYGLTEGDILAVFSQYGEIVNINLVRDKKTGKTKGFCFLCYANQKSTILAVDNFNGIKLCDRIIRVDHVANYKPPKEDNRDDEITKELKLEGCAPKPILPNASDSVDLKKEKKKKKKVKKEKKEHKKKKRKVRSDESDDDSKISSQKKIQIKKEKDDPGYDKYDNVPSKDSFSLDRRQQESMSSKDNFLLDKRRQYDNLGESYSSDRHKSKLKDQDHSYQSRETSHYHNRSVYEDTEKERSDHKYGQCNKSYKSKELIDIRTRKKHLKNCRSSSADSSKDSGNDSSKKKHSKDKYSSRRQQKSKNDFSSSTDDSDSSSDSSDNEKNSQSKSSQRLVQDVHDHKRTHDKHRHRSKSRNSADDTACKNRHYDQNLEKNSDHQSKSRDKRKDRYDRYSDGTYRHSER